MFAALRAGRKRISTVKATDAQAEMSAASEGWWWSTCRDLASTEKELVSVSHSFHGWRCPDHSKGLSCPAGAGQRGEARGHFTAASLCAASSSPAGASSPWQPSPLVWGWKEPCSPFTDHLWSVSRGAPSQTPQKSSKCCRRLVSAPEPPHKEGAHMKQQTDRVPEEGGRRAREGSIRV